MSSIKLFKTHHIRSEWDAEREQWCFNIVDVVTLLTDRADARAYWGKLKQRLKAEGDEIATNCHYLKMTATDGTPRFTPLLCDGNSRPQSPVNRCVTIMTAKKRHQITVGGLIPCGNKMRLDEKTRQIIKSEAVRQLGAKPAVCLFESRVDDTQRGGDIDLLIERRQPLAHRIQTECRLTARLTIKLSGRKVYV